MKAYSNRGTRRGRTTDGKNDGRVVVLALIADEGDKAETDKLSSHLRSFLPTDDGCEITEPLKCSHGGKTVLLDGCCRAAHDGLCSLGDVHESETLGALLISLKRFDGLGLGALRGIVRLATNEAAEEGGDDGLRNDDLVVN